VKLGKRKYVFIKSDIARDVDTTFRGVKALEPFMGVAIP
jgi:hypothetical protein